MTRSFDPMCESERDSLARLIEFVEGEVPEQYRAAVLGHLLPRVLGAEAAGGEQLPTVPVTNAAEGSLRDHPAAPQRIDLSAYEVLLLRRGEPLLKALIALHVGRVQLGIRWMTPAEIAFFLREVAGVRSAYRSNISNALRREETLVTRRPRGRGYEYGLVRRGDGFLERQLRLVEARGSSQ